MTVEEGTLEALPRASRPRLLFLLIFLIALFPKIIPSIHSFHPTPDAIEYLELARSLREEGHSLLPMRGFFHKLPPPPIPSRHPGEYERAPLFSWMLLPLIPKDPHNDAWLQLLPSFLGALLAVFVACLALLCAREAELTESQSLACALLAGIYVATYPPFFWNSTRLLSEPLAFCLISGGVALDSSKWRASSLLGGLLMGVLVMARPEGALAGFLWILLRSLEDWKATRDFALAWALVLVLWALRQYGTHGSLLPGQGFLFSITSTAEVQWAYGLEAPKLTLTHILRESAINLWRYCVTIVEPKNSAFMGLVIIAGLVYRPPLRSLRGRLWALALLLLLSKACLWATRDAYRFPTLPAFLWVASALPLLGALLSHRIRTLRGSLLLLVALIAVGPGLRILKRQTKAPRSGLSWTNPDLEQIGAHLQATPGVVLGATNPWIAHRVTRKDAVLLPNKLSKESLQRFTRNFAVTHILLCPRSPHPGIAEPKHYEAWLRAQGHKVNVIGQSLVIELRVVKRDQKH